MDGKDQQIAVYFKGQSENRKKARVQNVNTFFIYAHT